MYPALQGNVVSDFFVRGAIRLCKTIPTGLFILRDITPKLDEFK